MLNLNNYQKSVIKKTLEDELDKVGETFSQNNVEAGKTLTEADTKLTEADKTLTEVDTKLTENTAEMKKEIEKTKNKISDILGLNKSDPPMKKSAIPNNPSTKSTRKKRQAKG